LKDILIHPMHLAKLLTLFLVSCGEQLSLSSNFFELFNTLKNSSVFAEQEKVYTQWLDVIEQLLPVRLHLQLESQSTEANVTLSQLHAIYPLENLCQAISTIAKVADDTLQLRISSQVSFRLEDVACLKNTLQSSLASNLEFT